MLYIFCVLTANVCYQGQLSCWSSYPIVDEDLSDGERKYFNELLLGKHMANMYLLLHCSTVLCHGFPSVLLKHHSFFDLGGPDQISSIFQIFLQEQCILVDSSDFYRPLNAVPYMQPDG